ncbi:MAG: MFS transporter, partial [Stackebrandtia sp.]
FWAINLGYAVSMTAAGWLAQAGFLWLFWINAVTSVGFAVLVWRAVPETTPSKDQSERGSLIDALRDRVMLAFTAVVFGNALVYAQTYTMLPVAMTTKVGLDTHEFGMTVAINGVLIVAVQPLVTGWLGRRDLSRTLALGLVVMAVGFAATTFVTNVAWLVVTVVIWTSGEILTAGIVGTIIASLAPPHLRGRYSGLFGFAWSVATMVAPLLGGALLDVGSAALWLTIGAVGLAAAAGMLALGPAIRRRSQTSVEAAPAQVAEAV